MKTPLGTFTAFLASLLFSASVHAAPASQESIDALLAATHAESMVDNMYGSVERMMRQSMNDLAKGQPMTPEQQRTLDAVPSKFMKIMREELSWERMHPLYVQIYQESFSQEEIDGLLAFYRSPAGVAFVAKMPLVAQKSMEVMQTRMRPMMEKMKAAMQDAMAESKGQR